MPSIFYVMRPDDGPALPFRERGEGELLHGHFGGCRDTNVIHWGRGESRSRLEVTLKS